MTPDKTERGKKGPFPFPFALSISDQFVSLISLPSDWRSAFPKSYNKELGASRREKSSFLLLAVMTYHHQDGVSSLAVPGDIQVGVPICPKRNILLGHDGTSAVEHEQCQESRLAPWFISLVVRSRGVAVGVLLVFRSAPIFLKTEDDGLVF